MKNPISETIEMRAIAHINKGVDVIEAVKLAIEEENDMICSLYESGFLSERGKRVADIMRPLVRKQIIKRTGIQTRVV